MTVLQGGDSRVATGFGTGSEFVGLIKTDGNEVSGGGYQRQSATFQQSTEVGNTSAIVNAADIDFGTATANWGTINKVRIYSSATSTAASAQLFDGTVSSTTINSGDSYSIAAGNYQINIV